jgi:hypothetical protein
MDGRIGQKFYSLSAHSNIKSVMRYSCVYCGLRTTLWSSIDSFRLLNTVPKQWPHKQHQYHSTYFPVLAQEQSIILSNNTESSREKSCAILIKGNNILQWYWQPRGRFTVKNKQLAVYEVRKFILRILKPSKHAPKEHVQIFLSLKQVVHIGTEWLNKGLD